MLSPKERVGGGVTTSSPEQRTQGRTAEWQVGHAELPTPSVMEEVVTNTPPTPGAPLPISPTQIDTNPSSEAISEGTGENPAHSSHEMKLATSVGDSGTNVGKVSPETETRPVIAVSTMKGPAAFFNLARKFLVTYDACDLSALEGAIVSAIDAAHLLERSRLATIVRIETSYVAVEPRRKRQSAATARARAVSVGEQIGKSSLPRMIPHHTTTIVGSQSIAEVASGSFGSGLETSSVITASTSQKTKKSQHGKSKESGRGKELRRARIVITVRRTDDYRQWLEENPQLESSGNSGEGDDEQTTDVPAAGTPLLPHK